MRRVSVGVRLLLGAIVVAGLAAPTTVRAEPMVRHCPEGSTCAFFFTGTDYAGNQDARDVTEPATCLPLGSLAGSVRNDTPWPLALYSDHCSHAGRIAVVPAGGKLADIPGVVRSFEAVTCTGGSFFCLYSQTGYAGTEELEDAGAPATCQALHGPALSAWNNSGSGRTLTLYSGMACTAATVVATLKPGVAIPTLSTAATSFGS